MLSQFTLDHKEKIIFDPEKTELKNFQAPIYLKYGLHTLAVHVRIEENRLVEQFGDKMTLLISGGINPIVPNAFNWFSITIVNYLRFIGMIDFLNKHKLKFESLEEKENKKKLKNHTLKYMKRIIPEIYEWRNKVSAHFAAVDPMESDNIAILEYSVMSLINFRKKYFEVGNLNFGVGDKETNFKPWALTKVFEDLRNRFWPELKLDSFKKKKMNRGFISEFK